ncbi:LysR family transcriptional regulator [Oricola sp.]|uniref:LysR family transcriptional regulator n=1 Tax=Oricola sp. TaxID=1979950 RepID=UPI0025DD7AE4|nr:LysR family transcriptional regulator [Oricola sp.]MCI5073881.1 LysR family transcriptional regulator [Oricola sp.]
MLNLTMRQLRSLTAIEQSGKISIAANGLGLTGPAVTLQLKQAEEEIGMPLFDRTPDGMRPTAAGQAVLEAAHAIQERLRALEEEIIAFKGGKRGTLKLGAVSTAKYFAPRLIAAFQKTHPDIDIELFIGNRAETIEALRRQTIDIALMGRPPRDLEVEAALFGDHPLVIIAPADHRLVGKRDITKEEIAAEKFLVRERGSGTRISLEIFFADIPGKLENLGTEMGSNETIKQAVMAGLGVAFISAHTIEQELQLGRLAILDVSGMPIRRQWFSVSRSDRTASPAMRIFRDYLIRDGARHLPITPKTYPAEMISSYADTPLKR